MLAFSFLKGFQYTFQAFLSNYIYLSTHLVDDFETSDPEEKKETLIELMEYVRDNHTYIDRINTMFWFFNNIISKQN